MKLLKLLSIFFLLGLSKQTYAQEQVPVLLKSPNTWEFERIDFPLSFAPSIAYTGFEELRFAPGMFDTTASNYFTYIFALALQNKDLLSKKELKTFLLKYYRGLSSAVAQSKNMVIDTTLINVQLRKIEDEQYQAELMFIDAFTNGQSIKVHMEIDLFQGANNTSYLLALVSPAPKSGKQWETLHAIEEKLQIQKHFKEN